MPSSRGRGKKFQVKDLGSTNGTFVNGEEIEEATLNDGDLLAIAEVEFTFVSGGPDEVRESATQVMQPSAASPAAHHDGVWETILALRKHMKSSRSTPCGYYFSRSSIWRRARRSATRPWGPAAPRDAPSPRCEALAPAIDCRATDRMRQLFRRLAAEESRSLPPGARLFVAITAAESARVGWSITSADCVTCRRKSQAGRRDSRQLGARHGGLRALRAVLREAQIELAYDGFASGKAHITRARGRAGRFPQTGPFDLAERSPRRGPPTPGAVDHAQLAATSVVP